MCVVQSGICWAGGRPMKGASSKPLLACKGTATNQGRGDKSSGTQGGALAGQCGRTRPAGWVKRAGGWLEKREGMEESRRLER